MARVVRRLPGEWEVEMTAKLDMTQIFCHWCKDLIPNSPYRSPIIGTPGGRWVVCGPDCKEKPSDALVFPAWKAPWTK